MGSDCISSWLLLICFTFNKDAEVIDAFNSTSRYLDDLLNIDNTFFDSIRNCIYPS